MPCRGDSRGYGRARARACVDIEGRRLMSGDAQRAAHRDHSGNRCQELGLPIPATPAIPTISSAQAEKSIPRSLRRQCISPSHRLSPQSPCGAAPQRGEAGDLAHRPAHCRRRNGRSKDSAAALQDRPPCRAAGQRYRVATAGDATGCRQLLKNRLPQVKAALIFSLTPHAQFALFGSSVMAL
jgi:hypothetical protein